MLFRVAQEFAVVVKTIGHGVIHPEATFDGLTIGVAVVVLL